jgi:hypothetical protein
MSQVATSGRSVWSPGDLNRLAVGVLLHLACGRSEPSPSIANAAETNKAFALYLSQTPISATDSGSITTAKPPVLTRALVDTLRATRVFGDTNLLVRVVQMKVVGGNLLIADRRATPHIVVMDIATGRQVSSFGRHGRGPGEYQDPSSITPRRDSDTDFWIYDFSNRRASLIGLANPAKPQLLREQALNVGASLSNVVFADSTIVANGLFADFTLLVLDTVGRPLGRVRGTPPFDSSMGLTPVGLRLTNVNAMVPDPDIKRLAVAYQFAPNISVFDVTGREIKRGRGPRAIKASFRTDPGTRRFHWNNDNQSAYWAVEANDRFIYALFQGRADFVKPQPMPDRIHVFTWDAVFVREIVLDRPVLTFTVTSDGSRIYGFVEDPHAQIAEWALPQR